MSITDTPHHAAERMEALARHLAKILPPEFRYIASIFLMKARDPAVSIDRYFGFGTRAGGRGYYHGSPLPARNRRLRLYAAGLDEPTAKAKAAAILDRLRAGDPALVEIAAIAALPSSARQILRIIKQDDE